MILATKSMILATYFVSTYANTQNLIPYLLGLFGMNVMKGQRDFTGIRCSSIVRENLQLYFVWHIDKRLKYITLWRESICSRSSPLSVWLIIKSQIFEIFRNLSRGIVFEKTEIP